ncbi:MAG: anthranilate synthase component I [Chloroflexi bacterium]|nr:anthranilate synthase component I [Chloroflexota bacterium]
MYQPSLRQARELAERGNLIPVYREIFADLETPVSAYLKIAMGDYSFLLESVEGGERIARYSFIGAEPRQVMRFRAGHLIVTDGNGAVVEERRTDNPLDAIRQEMERYRLVRTEDLPRFHGGAVGYLSYEISRYFERLPAPDADPLDLPEMVILFVDTLLVFDHVKRKIKVVSHAHTEDGVEEGYEEAIAKIDRLVARLHSRALSLPAYRPAADSAPPSSNLTPEQFESAVDQAIEEIRAGEIIQVVISQRLARPTSAPAFDIYRALRTVNPSPYMFYFQLDGFHLVGASPELLVRVEDGLIVNRPLAGTRWRGKTPEEDRALEAELRADEKERAEHVMLVDLARNDVGRVSKPGSVKVTELMDVERYSHVMHLVSNVVGELKPELTAFDALRVCFPAGTVSGAPKIRAMEIIAELEPDRRGPYAGAVGYFSYSGNMDTCITLRTMVVKDGVAYVQAGGGVVADSTPAFERQESLNKARALLLAVEEAEKMGA